MVAFLGGLKMKRITTFLIAFLLITLVWFGCISRTDISYDDGGFNVTEPDTLILWDRPLWAIPLTIPYDVEVTIYYPVPEQTDDTPDEKECGLDLEETGGGESEGFCWLREFSFDLLSAIGAE